MSNCTYYLKRNSRIALGFKKGNGRTAFVQKKELKFQVTMDVHFYYYNNIWQFKKKELLKKIIKIKKILIFDKHPNLLQL